MGSFDIIKPLLSTLLSSSNVDGSQVGGRESNPGQLGEKLERYPLCYAAPYLVLFNEQLTPSKFFCENYFWQLDFNPPPLGIEAILLFPPFSDFESLLFT